MNERTPLILAALLLSPLPALHAADFSFDAPSGPAFSEQEKRAQREAGAGVVPRVLEAFHAGAESVRIPPGDYRFGKERWGHDGVIYALEFSDLQRDDAHPFTIDASGATLWFDLPDDQAPTCHFCVGFKDCRNIVFKGATIDRATRGHVEGRITQLDFANNRIELQLSPGIAVPETFNDKLEQRVIPFKADGTFRAPLYALQRGGVHLKYKHISPADADGRCRVTMADTALLDTIRSNGLLRVGDGLSCVYTVTSSLELIRCGKLTMDGIRVYAAKAWGAERGGFGAHVWKNCYFGPRPGTSQWQGGEGFMFNATRHGATLDRVTIRHTTDDTANFHGYWSPVESVAGTRVTFGRNEETRRALPRDLEVGDAAIFLARDTGDELGRANVAAIEGNTVTLDRSAGEFANALAEWSDHECAGWTIRNCDWSDNYQRLLIQSGPGTIRDCRFTRFGSAIELNSVLPYVEGGVPRDIRIENNVFTDINPQPGGAAITVYARAFRPDKSPTLRNIRITGNTFIHPNETAIALTGVTGGLIASNRFSSLRNPVRLNRCIDVNLNEDKPPVTAKPAPDSALAAVADVAGLPRVLLIGDSISIGYTLPTRALLKGRANVHRPPTNCSSTGNGLKCLKTWLGDKKWDVIHFNFGLHDAKLPPEGVRHAPPDVYERNLRELVNRLKATGAKLIWATTTPVPNGGNLAPNRRFGSVEQYNALAGKVMAENGVASDDLNSAIAPHVGTLQKPGDVHFTAAGSELLAKHVAASVEAALKAK